MGVVTLLIVGLVAVVAVVLALWAYRRATTPTATPAGTSKPEERAKQWGMEISAPTKERACLQVQEFLGKRFPTGEQPPLPLPSCAFPHQCECRYMKLFDDRRTERRSGDERRLKGFRMEDDKPPRRSGIERRKKMRVEWDRH